MNKVVTLYFMRDLMIRIDESLNLMELGFGRLHIIDKQTFGMDKDIENNLPLSLIHPDDC